MTDGLGGLAAPQPVSSDPGGLPAGVRSASGLAPGLDDAQTKGRLCSRPSGPMGLSDQSLAAYTCLPPTQVCSTLVFQILLAGSLTTSWSIRMKSAHLPGSSVPSLFSACSA